MIASHDARNDVFTKKKGGGRDIMPLAYRPTYLDGQATIRTCDKQPNNAREKDAGQK